MDKRLRERVEHLVNIYINWKLSTDENAGWHGETILQRLVDFKGDLPACSGNDQADLKMINEMRFLSTDHYELPRAKRIMASMKPRYQIAILSALVCRNKVYKKGNLEIRCDDVFISHSLGVSVDCYKKQVQRAYEKIIEADTESTLCCA